MKNEQKNKVSVSFELEDQIIDISDKFCIEFDQAGIIHKGKVDGHILTLPALSSIDEKIEIAFKYDKYLLSFSDLDPKWLFSNENMDWKFRIDYPPFDEINNDDLELDNLLEIHYFELNPEVGQAIEIINPVYK
jgi:hypothetical protein